MSSGVPSRGTGDVARTVRMVSLCGLVSSACQMGADRTPGLTVFVRAPRAPQDRAASCTRRWLARFAKPYAWPGSVKFFSCDTGS